MKKEVVIQVLADDGSLPEQYNKAFELYRQSVGKSSMLERNFNRTGYTIDSLRTLKYELQKMYGIKDVEIVVAKASGPFVVSAEAVKGIEVVTEASKGEFIKEISDTWETDAEERMVLRDEFPFLNAADCPEEFYILVGRKIAAFKRYQANHVLLREAESGEVELSDAEKTELAKKIADDFNENRKLWDELNYYAAEGKILGKHILFREKAIAQEVNGMSNDQLLKFVNSSVKYSHDQKKALEKYADDEKKLGDIHKRIEDREYKLSLVKTKLGLDE